MKFIPKLLFQITGGLALLAALILPVVWWTQDNGLFRVWKSWLSFLSAYKLSSNLIIFTVTLLSCLLIVIALVLVLQKFTVEFPEGQDGVRQVRGILSGELSADQPLAKKIFRSIGAAIIGLGIIILVITWLFFNEYHSMYLKLPILGAVFVIVGCYMLVTGNLPQRPTLSKVFQKSNKREKS